MDRRNCQHVRAHFLGCSSPGFIECPCLVTPYFGGSGGLHAGSGGVPRPRERQFFGHAPIVPSTADGGCDGSGCPGELMSKKIVGALLLLATVPAIAQIPGAAEQYRRQLIKESRTIWGLAAPVAVFAAQLEQESGWQPEARSRFAGGLAQFTPQTAQWICGRYRNDFVGLADCNVFDSRWSLRAMVLYDAHLWAGIRDTATECDRMAMTLASYNGGPGWVSRDRAKATASGLDPSRYFGHVDSVNYGRAPQFWRENTQYPKKILLVKQPKYLWWGAGIPCL